MLVFTTVPDSRILARVGNSSAVVPLMLDQSLHAALNALDAALDGDPPTSMEANRAWLSPARELGRLLAQQAARAGVPVVEWDGLPDRFSDILVAAERVIPIDLIPCRDSLLGTQCVVSHAVGGDPSEVLAVLLRSLDRRPLPLRRIAHVCTYDPGGTSLYEMDVVAATLKINNELAMEHYFYPTAEVAMGLFKRTDLDVLHFECHGTPTSIQVDHPFGEPRDVRPLQVPDGPSVYFFLGCKVGAHLDGVAPAFVRNGAVAAIGSYCQFLSGGDSGEVAASAFYDGLYQGMLSGKSLGESLMAGRRAAGPQRIYYCAWLLFGNAGVQFSPVRYGGSAG